MGSRGSVIKDGGYLVIVETYTKSLWLDCEGSVVVTLVRL